MVRSVDVVDRAAVAVGWTGYVSPKVDWGTVESRLGTPLPGDYKEWMTRFPSGMFRNSVKLYNPIQNRAHLAQFKGEFDRILRNVREVWEKYPEFESHPPFPESKGVIPFASDAAGGSLFWLPWTSDPDKWHVVYQSRHSPDDWTRTRRSMTAVMLELATSRSERNILRWGMAAVDRVFEPF